MFKSIGAKLGIAITALLLLAAAIIGFTTYKGSSNAMIKQAEERLADKAEDVARYVREHLALSRTQVEALAQAPVIESMDFAKQQKYLERFIDAETGFESFGIIKYADKVEDRKEQNIDGNLYSAKRPYIQEGFDKNETVISNVLVRNSVKQPFIGVVTPVEAVTGEKTLLFARISGYYLADLAASIKLGDTGYVTIFDDEGRIVGSADHELIEEQVNPILAAQETGEGEEFAEVTKQIIANDNGIATFKDENGKPIITSYTTIDNGWHIALFMPEKELLSELTELQRKTIIVTVVILIVGAIIATLIARTISAPIHRVVKISESLSTGDFTERMPAKYLQRQDEVGTMANAMNTMTERVRDMVSQINTEANEVTESSNLILTDMQTVTATSNNVVEAINEVEQSANIQTTMTEDCAIATENMAKGVHTVAESVNVVRTQTEVITSIIKDSQTAVDASITSMNAIQNDTKDELDVVHKLEQESKEIGAISNIITDISDQTNLLALNASIEAARAGDAGKGFVVVAEKVRVLADETAKSAAQINGLIKEMQLYTADVVTKAEQGEDNVEKGLAAIGQVNERFEEITRAVFEIVDQIDDMHFQAEGISAGTEQLSASMEEMAATAKDSTQYVEEVHAATDNQVEIVQQVANRAEELTDMSTRLRELVKQFKL